MSLAFSEIVSDQQQRESNKSKSVQVVQDLATVNQWIPCYAVLPATNQLVEIIGKNGETVRCIYGHGGRWLRDDGSKMSEQEQPALWRPIK